MPAVAPADEPAAPSTSKRRPPLVPTRWVARIVTIGVLAIFTFAAIGTVEAWPITSFRLFSQVRTDHASSTTLVAIDAAGEAHPVRADAHHIFSARTTQQYADLAKAPPERARAMVNAWFEAAGMNPDDYVAVELRRTSRRLHADGSPAVSLGEKTTWHLDLP